MKRAIVLAISILATTSALAQVPDWSRASQVTVTLSSFAFDPDSIHLHAGQPVVLHLVNEAGGGHNFSAPEFFAVATVRPQDQALLRKGAIEVAGHGTRDVALVPRAGTYKLRCTHTLHTAFGMTGQIVVD
jgi:uncharacterized cupredoxin-like copper-binding protein